MHTPNGYGWLALALCLIGLSGCGGGPSKYPLAAFTLTTEARADGTAVRVDASGCTDAIDGADALMVRWDWDGDGVYDTPYTPTKSTEHLYSEPGHYAIVLDVKNSGGYCNQFRAGVDVTPRLAITPAETSLSITETTQFTAVVTGCGNHNVTWMTTGGAISDGKYTAPKLAGRYRITAISAADATVAAAATVTVVSGGLDITIN